MFSQIFKPKTDHNVVRGAVDVISARLMAETPEALSEDEAAALRFTLRKDEVALVFCTQDVLGRVERVLTDGANDEQRELVKRATDSFAIALKRDKKACLN